MIDPAAMPRLRKLAATVLSWLTRTPKEPKK